MTEIAHVADYEQRLRDMNEALLLSSIRQQELTEKAERAEAKAAAAEQRQRLLVEGVPQLIWTAVDAGEWTWSSPQWTELTGLSMEDSRGLGWLQALDAEDAERVIAAWREAEATGAYEVEHKVRSVSGDVYRWFSSRATPVRDEGGVILEWLGTSTDINDLRQLQEEQKVMVAELQHRTRNLIAIVRSIARQTMERTGPTEAFKTQFNDRLAALARVQGLLSSADSEPITIAELIRMELDALGCDEIGKVALDGPEVRLPASVIQMFALALHELATNALKYGALAAPDGSLRVTWTVRQSDAAGRSLMLNWTETKAQIERKQEGPPRKGYGRELIERALPYALGARTSFELSEQGVHCTIDLPLSERASSRERK